MTRLWTGQVGLNSQQGQGVFLFATTSRPALGPTQPPNQWVLEALSPGVKQLVGCEAFYSPSTAEIKNAWIYTATPPYVFMIWYVVKHRDNFSFTFTLPYIL
jgi:hypothetical protein